MSVVDWGKTAFDIAQKLNNADLLIALAQLKAEHADRITEIAELKEQIRTLKEASKKASELKLQDGVYWDGVRPAELTAQPLCPACWDDKGKLIHMSINRGEYQTDTFQCPICAHVVDDPKGAPPKPINRPRVRLQDY